jgi:23S rRNA (adenine2030-N6)-methyltransferase
MLSYLHGFHAGNHADVLKHTVLAAILARLVAKDKPVRYIETHAGAGSYDLNAQAARKNREHAGGIGRIFDAQHAPPAVERLLALVREHNGAGALRRYPGSPSIARASLRPEDRMYLFELHPAEHRKLAQEFARVRNVKVSREDGLTGCVGLVPPPDRRALLFIDPSYERANEQREVIEAAVKAHQRFATGVIAIWYPIIDRRAADKFERALRATRLAPFATYELCVAAAGRERGLFGSGMFVVNPPWPLDDEIGECLPWLAKQLERDGGATWRCDAAS